MQDLGYELPRIPILRTPVNKSLADVPEPAGWHHVGARRTRRGKRVGKEERNARRGQQERQRDMMTSTRVLYISGSIGLGHVRRDLAIARELRRLDPEVEISWLAGDPARHLIAEAGETLLDESGAYGDETAVAEDTAEGFSLNLLGRFALRARGSVQWPSSRR